MTKIDFKKTHKHLYAPSPKDFVIVDVPAMHFLMIDGHGDPNTAQEYADAVEALYAVAYKLKFAVKKAAQVDYVVPPLEGLWWAEDMDTFTHARDKSAWDWTMMIMTPDWATPDLYEQAIAEVTAKKDLPALPKLRLESYHEGLSAQIMHIGSYDDEGPVLARLHNEWLPANGYEETGKHHEIYLSDPRRVAPEKMKTILRQPIRAKETAS
ncbi:MAG: GyrI-like domain-containing protein [Caldilineaceae bacterium]|nr:GyrI-like domain-containing protein [Caldilineaceae bacterium]